MNIAIFQSRNTLHDACIPRILLLWICASLLGGCTQRKTDWLANPLNQADQIFRWTDLADWERGDNGPDVSFASQPTHTQFLFDELLPSWNPSKDSNGHGLTFWVCTRDAEEQQWSPWLYIGQWGEVEGARSERPTQFAGGRVSIDVLELKRPADAFRVGVGLAGASEGRTLDQALKRMTIVVSGPAQGVEADFVANLSPEDRQRVASGMWSRDLDVPFLPQKMLPKSLWSRGCSPTATTMALRYRGIDDCVPATTAKAVYDAEHDIYGNWNRAVAYAGSLGLEAELARFRSWDQLKATIARGQPVVASIRFEDGEFPSNPMGDTDGHLILIRGLTDAGDAIVNDSALEEEGDGIVYKAEELAQAWLGKDGVAYVIGEPREERVED